MIDEPMIVRLTIESIDAESGRPVGMQPSADLSFYREDEDDAILEAIRALLVKRLDYQMAVAAVFREALDFDLPNQPTTNDIRKVIEALEKAAEFARGLSHLAPEELIEVDEEEEPS